MSTARTETVRVFALAASLFLPGAGILIAQTPVASTPSQGFDADVRPVLTETCQACHNSKLMSGRARYHAAARRRIARRPPRRLGAHRSQAACGRDAAEGRRETAGREGDVAPDVEREFDRIDRAQPVNPGRVTARRLNRQEYANTDARSARRGLPRGQTSSLPDDSGYGFDNIGDVLTVSPALMQKYLSRPSASRRARSAATRCRRPACSAPGPRPAARTTAPSSSKEIVECDAEYTCVSAVSGHRGATTRR